jgi:hypothetical protein
MRKPLLASLIPGALLACAMAAAAAAAHGANAPLHGSENDVHRSSNWTFGSPESDARPGEKFFLLGARKFEQGEYRLALDMYRVAASWASKPAEYNLAIMYLKGQGVAVDRPRAMAWLALAAERNDAHYVEAREALYADLDADEFAQANVIWRELKKTCGDAVALRRAKARWRRVRNNVTGSHVGATGYVTVGGFEGQRAKSGWGQFTQTGAGLTGSQGATDGSIAYRQLHQSDNPYDPMFEWRTSPTPSGTATVGPLLPTDDGPAETASDAGH